MIAIMLQVVAHFFETESNPARVLGAGSYLFHRDDPVVSMFLVVEGAVHLVRHQEDGTVIVLQRAEPGDVIAEASLFTEHYHCNAVALVPTKVRGIAKQRLLKKFRREPGFAEAWAIHLGRELRQSRLKSEILSLKTVASRLDAWLKWHPGGMPEKGAWKQIASQIGVSPEALYRELAKRKA